jgi:Predicted flavin-nucleotide-binding protein structurally related to pyridoxine 5''-phosphate oxidase
MVKLTSEIKAAFSATKLFPVATASKAGEPNVSPHGFVLLVDDETIWLGDIFMKNTIKNVQENPKVAIYLQGPEVKGCYQIKANATVKSDGPEFAKLNEAIAAKMPGAKAKHVIIGKITGVYQCVPGPNAGDKIL